MKIFEKDGKINFVDENNVYLGYDMELSCCENADWFIADTPQENQPNEERKETPNLDGFVFDKAFFKHVEGGDFDGGGMAIFRVVNGSNEKFIHIFNSQNGYYGHGFDFSIEGKSIQEGSL